MSLTSAFRKILNLSVSVAYKHIILIAFFAKPVILPMQQLIINIGSLAGIREESTLLRGTALSELLSINNAFLLIENGVIKNFGNMNDLQSEIRNPKSEINANGATVLPCWCDSHTHLVFAASREEEFVSKLEGKTYAEIAAKGGGILNSAHKLNSASENELYEKALFRLNELMKLGTGAIEIKSGYGLTLEAELKILRVIKRLKETANIPVKATFLGAHAYPEKYKDDHEGYIKLIINEMLPNIAAEGLADYIDVFCEKGFFSVEEMIRVCEAGAKYGLKPKLHVNQLNSIGGIEAGIKLGAVSLDHLETMTDKDIRLLAKSEVIGTLLPTAAFFLRMQYQPARQMIDNACIVALASDFNPGSSPSGNMNFVVSLSCIQMKMLPEEAINAATINGAYAMGVQDEAGSIVLDKKANLIFTKPIPSLAYLPYSFGTNLIDKVMINGQFI